MTNDKDVQWLDEMALHQQVIGGNPEAFAELIRRFDPVVRTQLARAASEELIEDAMAEFWIALIRDPRLRTWEPERGGLFAQWIAALAAQVARLRDPDSKRAA